MSPELEDKLELENPEAKSSMNHWFPKIRECDDISHPKTVKVEMTDDSKHHRRWYNEEDVVEAVEQLGTGYPVFVRTDMASNKHRMKEASRIESEDDIQDSILHLIEFNETASLMGLPYESLYLREWVELEHHFKAFQETPIAKEVRFFIADGEVLGGHFYWPQDSIKFYKGTEEPDNWRMLWGRTYSEVVSTAHRCRKQLEAVTSIFDGFWSVDFAKTKHDGWQLIDMARAEVSWHPQVRSVQDFTPDKYRQLYGSNNSIEVDF